MSRTFVYNVVDINEMANPPLYMNAQSINDFWVTTIPWVFAETVTNSTYVVIEK